MSGPDSFANYILADWDTAMGEFFRAVECKAKARDLTTKQVEEALNRGYGDEVADAWFEYMSEDES